MLIVEVKKIIYGMMETTILVMWIYAVLHFYPWVVSCLLLPVVYISLSIAHNFDLSQ